MKRWITGMAMSRVTRSRLTPYVAIDADSFAYSPSRYIVAVSPLSEVNVR